MRYASILILAAGCGGDVNFNSNPDDNTTLDGAAVMELSIEALEWSDLEVGKARSQTLIVTSTGDNPLRIDSAKALGVDASAFFLQEEEHADLELLTGQSHEITVVCNLEELVEITAYLRLDTNDSELPIRDVPLHGTPLGWTADTDADTDGGM